VYVVSVAVSRRQDKWGKGLIESCRISWQIWW